MGVKITEKELSEHNSAESLWVAVHGKVFDLTDFFMEHPGGWEVIEEVAGSDATEKYEEANHRAESVRDIMKYYQGELQIPKLSPEEQ